MKKTFILFLLLFYTAVSFAAFENKRPGARPAGMGGAFTALADDSNALYYNPGGLGFVDRFEAVFSHTDLFSLQDLRYDAVSVVVPAGKRWSFGGGYSQFGPAMYREIESVVGVGVRVLDNAAVGVALKRLDLRIRDYGSAYDWAGSVGFLGKISSWLYLGMHGRNIFSTHVGKTDEFPEKEVSFGMRIVPRPYLNTLIEFGREMDGEQFTYRLGQEVFIKEYFIVRFGFHNYPDRSSGGFGIRWQGIGIDYGIIMHPQLDLQHQFSVLMSWE